MTIDVAALRKSALFVKHRQMLRDFIVPGFAACGYDPFDSIETVTIGL